MPQGFRLYFSAAAIGLLSLGRPVPAQASDAPPSPAISSAFDARAAATSVTSGAASSILSSISQSSSAVVSSSVAYNPSTSPSISASIAPSSHSSSATASFIDTETCQSKTVNYITHTLPQQCLRTSWSSANATASSPDPSGANATTSSSSRTASETDSKVAGKEKEQGKDKGDATDAEDLATESFMSFEEWKVLQLKKAGQDPAELHARRRQQQQQQRNGHYPHGAGGDINIDSIGDDGEIALDFDVLNEKVSEMAGAAVAQASGQYYEGGGNNRRHGQAGTGGDVGHDGGSGTAGQQDNAVVYADGAAQYYRSKDAGKTGKERFSFASFDAGATILKTNKGVKNAKAILVENKDSYMLLECRTRDKYVIVEMSDDILVDTVVLANFEFFSSMVRRFRVSVSDRYPVKADRWRTLGEFEARNSRDIQPFLVEHPQIWAKYIRIDFLTHYGSEYYCPISLLRVHGTRMLDSWKDSENGRDDDEEMEQEQYQQHQHEQQQAEQQPVPEPQQPVEEHVEKPAPVEQEQQQMPDTAEVENDVSVTDPAGVTPWNPVTAQYWLFDSSHFCSPLAAPSLSLTHCAASGADHHGQPCYGAHPADAQDDGNNTRLQSPLPSTAASSSSIAPEKSAFKSAPRSRDAARDGSSSSPASSPPASTTSSSSSLNASASPQSTHHSSDTLANGATAPLSSRSKTASNHQKPSATPGTHEDSHMPPTATAHTPHNRNKAGAGGSGVAGASSHSSGSAHSGPGSNSGATPGGGASSSAGSGSNSNGNGGGPASGSSNGAPLAPPPPVVQESFFKSITKRLQLLESNTSQSLQYIEDQSRFLQDALRKMERRQISRVDLFLDTLNNTVMSELRNMRQQYDQIWQSTVIALETQREQNQRETVALSDRLNVLADEVVFQKRMAILQSALLLCCLALVIFSRGLLSGGSPSVPLDVNAAAAGGYMAMPLGSSATSPALSSPPSAPSPSYGLRPNLQPHRYSQREPYTDRLAYSPDFSLQDYASGSPFPHDSSLRREPPMRDELAGGSKSGHVYETDDSMELHGARARGPCNPIAVPRSLTPPASLCLSDIEEVADPVENESEADSKEDQGSAAALPETNLAGPESSRDCDSGDFCQFMLRAVTPPLTAVSDDDRFLPAEMQKRLSPLPEYSSD
ncbi:hypothetical protein SEPCBS119000_000070 [Sporothrix epigloea]|uniref:SUN domain-containing protein n=1 Tax=Sporothrix epigloea TaxID=1892477 RepID=A0ABP0D5P1_9PEZI